MSFFSLEDRDRSRRGRLPSRPKHPIKELEAVLQDAETRKWHVVRKKGYYKMLCPCPDKHKKNVALTPSGGYYVNHLRQ